MTKRKLCVGLVGLGGVGSIHLEAYRDSSVIELVAAAEIDDAKRANLQARYGFRPYADFRQMLRDEALDLVCVATPVGHSFVWHFSAWMQPIENRNPRPMFTMSAPSASA